ncbi:hypothetical protein HG537_0D02350 [Torulaspora globosa]|uniref:Sugar phosphate transporter domain-containing protein n=1 Tax=Torulaspora globosa TaxID=48254 RepID=A0A7H9HR62_9SACH|nr:hypothetical protein HG537_0D02350 [Torulaspora sp. CBS 2947]
MTRWISGKRTGSLHIVLLCLCWYLISSLGSQVTKKILTVYPKPLLLGEFQFIYTALLACLCCLIGQRFYSFYRCFPKGTFPSYYDDIGERRQINCITRPSRHLFLTIIPLGFCQFVGKYFGHTATCLVPVSTVASIKTLSPIFIVLTQRTLNLSKIQLGKTAYFSLLCLIIGVWIIVREDYDQKIPTSTKGPIELSAYSSYGIICAICSMLIFVAQNIYGKSVFTYQKKVISGKLNNAKAQSPLPSYITKKTTNYDRKNYDKLTLLLYIPLVGFCLSFGWFMTLEFPEVWSECKLNGFSAIPWKLFLVNGTFHFLQAMITFHLLGEISTLSYSIANLMKRIAIITVSWALSGVQVTMWQIVGLLLNVFGLFLYERSKSTSIQDKRT